MNKKVLVFALIVLMAGSSCDKDDPGIDKLSKLDIVNASSLFIASDARLKSSGLKSSSLKNSFQGSKLFKITGAGYVEEVHYLDENGNEMTLTNYPNAVYDVCENYIIVVFDQDSVAYLVRKSDGAVFSLTDIAVPLSYISFVNYRYFNVIQTDDQGRAYYRAHGTDTWGIVRVNFSNPELITVESLTPSNESVTFFKVNNYGVIIYHGFVDGEVSDEVFRLVPGGGGLINVPYGGNKAYWRGTDGEIYYLRSPVDEKNQIIKFRIENNNLVQEEYGPPYDLGTIYWWELDNAIKLTLQDKLYIINKDEVFEVQNPEANPHKVTGLGMSTVRRAVASGQYYYLAGNDEAFQPSLKRVNSHTNTAEDILPPGQYDVYNMTISHDDRLTFSAVRMSDGKRIIGEIDGAMNLTIIDEEMDTEVVVLQRIN